LIIIFKGGAKKSLENVLAKTEPYLTKLSKKYKN
jgi:hypothetical protein